jgi:hypothetical protein
VRVGDPSNPRVDEATPVSLPLTSKRSLSGSGATGCLLCDPLTENMEWDLMDPEERRTELAGFSFEGGINYIKARNIDYFFLKKYRHELYQLLRR